MSDTNVKTISITGNAATEYIKNMNGGKRTRRKIRQQGGDHDEDITPPVSNTITNKINITKSDKSTNIQPLVNNSINVNKSIQEGGGEGHKPKIVIAPKQKTRKIIIAPKHQQKPVIKLHQNKKRRLTKRLCVPIMVVKNKIAKTRKHITESQQLPIDKIRKTLIDAKLLNPASKAPEILIRKIYADFKIIE